MWTYLQNRNRVTDTEDNLIVTWGKGRRGINWEIGIDIYMLLYIKQMSNKHMLYLTGNSTPYYVMTYVGKESKKEWRYLQLIHFSVQQNQHNIVKKEESEVAQSCLTATPWIVPYQAPQFMQFSRQEYWSVGCHFLLQHYRSGLFQ